MSHAPRLYASLLNADLGKLADQVAEIEASGVIDGLHIDVMDGHFVPNLALGPQCVQTLKSRTRLPMEVHLMVQEPGRFFEIFRDAGARRVIVHEEACPNLHRDVVRSHDLGMEAGVALNPATSPMSLDFIIEKVELILLMGVDPGFGGQSFIESVAPKIRMLREDIDARYARAALSIDGGVKLENAERLTRLGADTLVIGSALFGPPGITASCRALASLFTSSLAATG